MLQRLDRPRIGGIRAPAMTGSVAGKMLLDRQACIVASHCISMLEFPTPIGRIRTSTGDRALVVAQGVGGVGHRAQRSGLGALVVPGAGARNARHEIPNPFDTVRTYLGSV
jgi:hypothetical protein